MKKLTALLSTMALMLAATAPAAFADTVAIDRGDEVEFDGVGQNIISSVGDIDTGNSATATATAEARATGDSAAAADSEAVVTQDSGVEVSQSNFVGNGFDADLDDDGILDEFDVVILSGDLDNDGFLDEFEVF